MYFCVCPGFFSINDSVQMNGIMINIKYSIFTVWTGSWF